MVLGGWSSPKAHGGSGAELGLTGASGVLCGARCTGGPKISRFCYQPLVLGQTVPLGCALRASLEIFSVSPCLGLAEPMRQVAQSLRGTCVDLVPFLPFSPMPGVGQMPRQCRDSCRQGRALGGQADPSHWPVRETGPPAQAHLLIWGNPSGLYGQGCD